MNSEISVYSLILYFLRFLENFVVMDLILSNSENNLSVYRNDINLLKEEFFYFGKMIKNLLKEEPFDEVWFASIIREFLLRGMKQLHFNLFDFVDSIDVTCEFSSVSLFHIYYFLQTFNWDRDRNY